MAGPDFFQPDQEINTEKFDMQDSNDIMRYERIKKEIHINKNPLWEIVDEDRFSDKFCNVFILMTWKQPKPEWG